jgi:hypothetical protein
MVQYSTVQYSTVQYNTVLYSTAQLHLPVLIETVRHPDIQTIRIIELFFENRLHWQFEVLAVTIYSMYLRLELSTTLYLGPRNHKTTLYLPEPGNLKAR